MKHETYVPAKRDLVLQFHRSSVIKRSTDANDFVNFAAKSLTKNDAAPDIRSYPLLTKLVVGC